MATERTPTPTLWVLFRPFLIGRLRGIVMGFRTLLIERICELLIAYAINRAYEVAKGEDSVKERQRKKLLAAIEAREAIA